MVVSATRTNLIFLLFVFDYLKQYYSATDAASSEAWGMNAGEPSLCLAVPAICLNLCILTICALFCA